MIQSIEEFCAELHAQALGYGSVLVDCKVPVAVVGSNQRISAFVAEMACAGDAICSRPRWTCVHCARYCERTQVDVVKWIALVIHNRTSHIRAINALASSAEIVFEVVIHLEWLTTLQCQ